MPESIHESHRNANELSKFHEDAVSELKSYLPVLHSVAKNFSKRGEMKLRANYSHLFSPLLIDSRKQ